MSRFLTLPAAGFLPAENVLMVLHGDSLASETYALHFETDALLVPHLLSKANHAACTDHALPGQRVSRFAQQLDHLAVVERVARGGRHLGVGGHFAARDLENHPAHRGVTLLGRTGLQQAPCNRAGDDAAALRFHVIG